MSELEAPAKSPEGIIESKEPDYSVLPECPPHKWDVNEVFSSPEKDRDNLPRYYASQLIKLSEYELPSSDFFTKNLADMTKDEFEVHKRFINYVMTLVTANDICDKEGINFLSNVFNLLKGNLSENFRSALKALSEYNKGIVKYAKARASI